MEVETCDGDDYDDYNEDGKYTTYDILNCYTSIHHYRFVWRANWADTDYGANCSKVWRTHTSVTAAAIACTLILWCDGYQYNNWRSTMHDWTISWIVKV